MMSSEPDYIVDIGGIQAGHPAPADKAPPQGDRRWLGVRFECCDVYSRIYRNHKQTAYVGHCPRCGRPVRVRIGPGGTTARFFRAT